MKCWHRFWKPHDEIHDFGVMMNVFLFFCSLSSHFPPFSQKPKRFKLKTFLMRDTIRCDTASTLTILGFSRKSKDGNDKWKRTIIGMSSSSASTPEMGRSLHPPGWPFEALHSSFERLLTTSTAATTATCFMPFAPFTRRLLWRFAIKIWIYLRHGFIDHPSLSFIFLRVYDCLTTFSYAKKDSSFFSPTTTNTR